MNRKTACPWQWMYLLCAVMGLLAGCSDPESLLEEPEMGRLIDIVEPHRKAGDGEGSVADVWSSEIQIIYGDIEPGSLRAWLNGKEVTTAFSPEPKRLRRVDLGDDLRLGMNELVVEVSPRLADGRVGRVREYRKKLNRGHASDRPPERTVGGGIFVSPPSSPPPGE